jgi:hypothetical protein
MKKRRSEELIGEDANGEKKGRVVEGLSLEKIKS